MGDAWRSAALWLAAYLIVAGGCTRLGFDDPASGEPTPRPRDGATVEDARLGRSEAGDLRAALGDASRDTPLPVDARATAPDQLFLPEASSPSCFWTCGQHGSPVNACSGTCANNGPRVRCDVDGCVCTAVSPSIPCSTPGGISCATCAAALASGCCP